jgi:hypothetical protein
MVQAACPGPRAGRERESGAGGREESRERREEESRRRPQRR